MVSFPLANALEIGAGGGTIEVLGASNILTLTPLSNIKFAFNGPFAVQGGGTLNMNLAIAPTIGSDASLSIAGSTTVNAGGTVDPFSNGAIHMAVINNGSFNIASGTKQISSLSGAGITNLSANARLTVVSVAQDTLNIGSGATLTIAPFAGGAIAGTESLFSVPEPTIWAMLIMVVMGLGIYRCGYR